MGLALETLQGQRIPGYPLRQELEGNSPFQPEVLGFVHHTHAAFTELFKDAVVGNSLASHFALASQTLYIQALRVVKDTGASMGVFGSVAPVSAAEVEQQVM